MAYNFVLLPLICGQFADVIYAHPRDCRYHYLALKVEYTNCCKSQSVRSGLLVEHWIVVHCPYWCTDSSYQEAFKISHRNLPCWWIDQINKVNSHEFPTTCVKVLSLCWWDAACACKIIKCTHNRRSLEIFWSNYAKLAGHMSTISNILDN